MEVDAGDDGRIRSGTLATATAHAFTAIIGAGILALPWSVAQLGWIVGCFVLISFAIITYYTAILLCDCYRAPDPVHGRRNYTYIGAVRTLLGPKNELLCGIMQYTLLWGTMVGYTVTTAVCVATVKRTICFHAYGQKANCGVSGNLYMLVFGAIQILLSQCPNLEKVAFLSVVATVTSFAYALIALGLCTAKVCMDHQLKGSLVVAVGNSKINEALSTKVWHSFQALGNIAVAYTFSMLLVEIQDTLKSDPPENKVMKRVSLYAISGTTLFYISVACMGYAAFGNDVAGNILAGFYEPFWLVDIANLSVIIHIIGAYQVFAQPVFAINEKWVASRWPASFFTTNHTIKFSCIFETTFSFALQKLFLRPLFVILTTAIAMMFPFFNGILGLLGAISFWPLTVYFPVSMYIEQAKIKRGSNRWIGFQALSLICLIVSVISAVGSVAGMLDSLKKAKLFHIDL